MTTDLKYISQVAKDLLYLDPIFNDRFSFVVSHPFISSNYLMLPKGELFDIHNEDKLSEYRLYLSNVIDESDVSKLLMMIEKPYRLKFLLLIYHKLNIKDLAETLRFCWTTSSAPNYSEQGENLRTIKKLFKISSISLMNEDELKVIQDLPDEVTVYRGQNYNGKYYKALSWTLSLDEAEWFGHRYNNKDGKIFKAKINKKYIFCYLNTLDEAEVILDYNKLTGIEEI